MGVPFETVYVSEIYFPPLWNTIIQQVVLYSRLFVNVKNESGVNFHVVEKVKEVQHSQRPPRDLPVSVEAGVRGDHENEDL